MQTSIFTLALAVWLAAPVFPTHTPRPQARESRTRDVYVSVVDAKGAPVSGLTASDFVVREDGVAREVLNAVPATDPLQIALVVDDSQAATRSIQPLREGLTDFIDKMRGKAEIALIAVGERPTSLAQYTTDTATLEKAVGRVFARPGAGAYLSEGLLEVSQGLLKRHAARPVIVVITFPGVEYSNMQYEQVLGPLVASGATLHVLEVGMAPPSTTDEMRNRNLLIAQGTTQTGGRREQLLADTAIPVRMRQLADELLSQYIVTYLASRHADSAGEAVGVGDEAGRDDACPHARGRQVIGATRSGVAVLLAVGLAATLAARQPVPPQQQPGRIRTGIELVSLNVTVSDGAKYVTGLTPDEFEVFEDGVKQTISFFSNVQQPSALAILLDTSNSMEEKLSTAQEAAVGFARRMRADDRIEVIDFNSQVRIVQPFTSDVDALERGDPRDNGQRIHVAVQRHLHFAEGTQAGARAHRRGHPPAGHRGALRRRRHVEPRRVRRGAGPREALGDGDLRDRPEAVRLGPAAVQGGGVRAAAVVPGDRRTGIFPRLGRRAAKNLPDDFG